VDASELPFREDVLSASPEPLVACTLTMRISSSRF
jgi:hypothetical protein